MTAIGNDKVTWRGFGDSEIGPLHERLGLPNQDAYHLEIGDEYLLIVLSDGLGSRSKSDLGAQSVCRAVAKLAQWRFDDEAVEPESLLRLFHKFWLDGLGPVDIEACRCTALFAITIQDQFFLAQLGDGACCIVGADDGENTSRSVHFLNLKGDELFANQTRALGPNFQIDDWQYCLYQVADVDACFLVTDGIFDDIAETSRNQFFLEMLNQYQHLSDKAVRADVRNWISQWPVSGHSDDKTIVALFKNHA